MSRIMMTVLAALLIATAAFAAPMTYSGNLDIGQMMNEAQKVWDFEDHDSILLLESVRYSYTADNRLTEEHHRVVWISSEHGIDDYADLRVPYDSDRQDLNVEVLRTWRDDEDRWIEARSTAVVPTTPYAFRHAPDYTGIRETMILHDGIELPCVLECIYVIEDKQAYRSGFEGQFIFQKNDPALNSWLIIETTQATPLVVKGFNGATTANRDISNTGGLDKAYSFRMKNMEPAPIPGTNDPAAYLPHVQFSTYSSWNQLGNVIKGEFLTRSMINDVLRDSLETLLVDAETMIEKAHRIADFVDSHQRYIGYDPSWFVNRVRSAGRVYDTGYGVSMDQCVLTAAMMREAGFEVWPVLLSDGFGAIDEGVATLARFQSPGVWVSGPGVEAYFDPSTGTLHNGLSPIYNRTVWLPGFDDQPTLRWSGDGEGSRLVTSFDLSWDADAEMWAGTGYYEAGGGYCPFDKMEGGGDRSREYLNDVCSSVLSGADVDEFSPMSFDRFTVASDLSLSVPALERDDLDRLPFVIGDPADGLIDILPHYVPLNLAERGTPVSLGGSGEQVVKVKLNVAGLEVVRLPEPVTFNNGAGSFELTVAQDGDVVTIIRSITILRSKYSVEEWTDLRALLLAEVSESNRTILLK